MWPATNKNTGIWVSRQLPWQIALHTCCHSLLLGELSMSSVTPLGKDSLTFLPNLIPCAFSTCWFCYYPLTVIKLSRNCDYMLSPSKSSNLEVVLELLQHNLPLWNTRYQGEWLKYPEDETRTHHQIQFVVDGQGWVFQSFEHRGIAVSELGVFANQGYGAGFLQSFVPGREDKFKAICMEHTIPNLMTVTILIPWYFSKPRSRWALDLMYLTQIPTLSSKELKSICRQISNL